MKPTQPRLVFALDLVAETNAMIRAAFDARQHVTTEKSANDFATETDAAVEALIAERIATAFPGDTLLGEEGGARALGDAPSTGVRWIVDPIDGTFNFVHGFPYVATSIAVERDGVVEAGVITNPIYGECFYAERGGGAWLRTGTDEPRALAVSRCAELSKALVGSVLPSAAAKSFDRVLPAWLDVARSCGSIRRTGAAALDLAQVAAGRMDGFFVMSLAAWDAAAGALLVREAGGFVCDFEGGDRFLETNQVIAGNAAVSSQLAKVLAPHAT
ncbi:MAG TPA: inositol monophosphatase family protein [Casimicrobium sp.]|nr:inositol monophosphatase family protein [Casimicrobium sp.]